MFSKSKKSQGIDSEQREQYQYARKKINQKKNLMRHFIFFLAGSVLFIILDAFLEVGEDLIGRNWYVWAILIWAFIFLIHSLNVFLMNNFMGKEWENRQLEMLKTKQAERMIELRKKVDQEFPLSDRSDTFKEKEIEEFNNPLPPKLQ